MKYKVFRIQYPSSGNMNMHLVDEANSIEEAQSTIKNTNYPHQHIIVDIEADWIVYIQPKS